MRKNTIFKYTAMGAILVVGVYMIQYVMPILALEADAASSFASLIPALILLSVGFMGLPKRGVFTALGMIGVGFGLALLSGSLSDVGWLPAMWYTPLTLPQIKAVILVVCAVFGIVLGLITRN